MSEGFCIGGAVRAGASSNCTGFRSANFDAFAKCESSTCMSCGIGDGFAVAELHADDVSVQDFGLLAGSLDELLESRPQVDRSAVIVRGCVTLPSGENQSVEINRTLEATGQRLDRRQRDGWGA